MNDTGREIERKYVVGTIGEATMELVDLAISRFLPSSQESVTMTSTDVYWMFPGADFLRLRKNSRELTFKRTDRGSIEDRQEENLLVESFEGALTWATAAFGKPVGDLEKTFKLYTLPQIKTVISLYQVTGDPRVFMEIEADSLETVESLEFEFRRILTLSQQHQSLFQLMFGGSL